MNELPNYLVYENWPAWAKRIHFLTLKAEKESLGGPVPVSDTIRPMYDEVRAAIAENRLPCRDTRTLYPRPPIFDDAPDTALAAYKASRCAKNEEELTDERKI